MSRGGLHDSRVFLRRLWLLPPRHGLPATCKLLLLQLEASHAMVRGSGGQARQPLPKRYHNPGAHQKQSLHSPQS